MTKQKKINREFAAITGPTPQPGAALLVSVNFAALLAQCDNDDRKALEIIGDLKALLR